MTAALLRTTRPMSSARRIMRMLNALSLISDTPAPEGVTRLGYSLRERQAHARFAAWAAERGMSVRVDAAGNTIAERSGQLPAIAIGSHLDSVPAGGRFDGTAGIVAGLEVVRLIEHLGLSVNHALRIVAFACEEGARFGSPCLGSRAVCGALPGDLTHRLCDADGITLPEAMRSVGIDPDRLAESRWDPKEWQAFIELHIEQGAVLERAGLDVGVVDSVAGSTRYELAVTGTSSHSGTTPMVLRADALTAAAEIVLAAEAAARRSADADVRCTVGRFEVMPGSITTIPGRVVMTLDVRSANAAATDAVATELFADAQSTCARRAVSLDVSRLVHTAPVALCASLRAIVEQQCALGGIPYRVMASGASHDAQVLSSVVPTAMIFVPSAAGLSHVPGEWSSPEWLARGTDVLLATVLALDANPSWPTTLAAR